MCQPYIESATTLSDISTCGLSSYTAKNDMLYEMCKCIFIDITNIFVNMTDFSCHFNQKDALRIPNECLCVILTYYFLICRGFRNNCGSGGSVSYNCLRLINLCNSFQVVPERVHMVTSGGRICSRLNLLCCLTYLFLFCFSLQCCGFY